MILSLTTPKRRVTCPDGTIFFNEYYDTLHVDRSGVQEPIALNLGSANWTVSDAAEVAFLCQLDDVPHVVIVDPARRTRATPSPARPRPPAPRPLRARLGAAAPGYLVLGRRTPEGALSWTGMRALDCGTEFHFSVDETGAEPRLDYSKRGSCQRHSLWLDSGRKEDAFWPERLQRILFREAFSPVYLPPLPEGELTLSGLLDLFRETARTHPGLTPPGLRLLALLFLLDRMPGATMDALLTLARNDALLQYAKGLDEPFPTMALMQQTVTLSHAGEIVPGRLIQPQAVKWSRTFEGRTAIGRRARIIRKVPLRDIPVGP